MRITMMCLQNLFRRKSRTFLSITGFALATMFIVAIGSTTSGYVEGLKEMNMFFSDDVVVVARGVLVIQAFPIGGTLQEITSETLKHMVEVQSVVPMLFIPNLQSEDGSFNIVPKNITIGIPLENIDVLIGSTTLQHNGRWPNPDSNEVIIGLSLAEQYNLAVESPINIKNQDLIVVGVLETRSALLSRTIIMSLDLAQQIYRYNMLINMIVVKPEIGVTAEELAGEIENEIDGVKALTDTERNEFIEPIINETELWNLGLKTALFLMSFILITTVSMMNISERRRDFATLNAIGASKVSVARIVITETTIIGFIGGAVGIVFGGVASNLIKGYYTSIPISFTFDGIFTNVSLQMTLEILTSTVVIGVIAGLISMIIGGNRKLEETLRAEY